MINTALNRSDIAYLLMQQERLDQAMREKHKIKKFNWIANMDKEHTIALNVEVHEFINAAFQVWKYWKKKDMVMADVLDEAIDVIHFCMLQLNKINVNTEELSKRTANYISDSRYLEDRNDVKNLMYKLTNVRLDATNTLVGVLRILDYYGYTSQDIIHAYNKKNKVNFERMAEGY